MARTGRIDREVSTHLYAINELLMSSSTAELRAFERRLNALSDRNCGWILHRAKPLLENLLAKARRDRRRFGIYKRAKR